jgi:hypothetical protein
MKDLSFLRISKLAASLSGCSNIGISLSSLVCGVKSTENSNVYILDIIIPENINKDT